MNVDWQKWQWGVLALITTLVFGGADWLSGYELNFFVFYFLPIALAAWYYGMLGAFLLAIFCSVVWFGAAHLTGHQYPSDVHAVWNTMIRLLAFVSIGWSVSKLKHTLDREKQTSEALRRSLSEIKVLEAILPICSQCKKIRDDKGVWQHLEVYISQHADTRFSHSYCPECYKRVMDTAGLLNRQE
jgi:hypothetical protein